MVDKTKKPRTNNLVAKHARKYNKSNVMTDRKKAQKRGYEKHSKDVRTQEGVEVESLDNAKSEKDSAQIKLRHANQKVRLAKKQERERQMKEGFVPHDMYHPETGEKRHAKTKATHLVLKAKGWTHNPKEEIDSAAKKSEKYTKADGKVGTRMVPAHKKVMDESVEQVDEGMLNDIRDFIVAVGAAIPTKKNKQKQNKGLEDQIRSAMQEDPEFDKLVRNAAYVRKDGIVAFKAGSLSELQAYVRKTVDAKTAEKLGTLVQSYMKTMRNGEKKNIRSLGHSSKQLKADIKSGKVVYTPDMEKTLQFTTDQIVKVIKRVTLAANSKNIKEDVIAEAISAVVVKKMQDMVGGADKMPRGAEFRKLKAKAQAAVKAERAGKKAAPKAKTTTKTAKGRVHKGSADAADRNLIMQLRKAQDIDGKMDIQVSPAGRTIRLSKKQIDTFLAKHDSLTKPVDKRKFKILLTKALRAKAK